MEDNVPFGVGVVLPAAGCGERMKLLTPKQFCDVNGRPLLCYTVENFHRLPWIQSIVISTSRGHIDKLEGLVNRYRFHKVTIVEGDITRHRSIHAGLKALQQLCPDKVEVVVIHDAVRPLIAQDLLRNIVLAAHKHGAAGVCRPLVSTVIARDADNRLTESLDRSQYFNSEMPQAFQVSVISNAYDQCTSDDFDYGTECLLLALKYSKVQAYILDGDADLWKVTYKKDLFSAEAVLRERHSKIGIIFAHHWPDLADRISAQLNSLQFKVVQQSQTHSVTADCMSPSGLVSSVVNAANMFVVIHTHPNFLHLTDSASLHSHHVNCSSHAVSDDKTACLNTPHLRENTHRDTSGQMNAEGAEVDTSCQLVKVHSSDQNTIGQTVNTVCDNECPHSQVNVQPMDKTAGGDSQEVTRTENKEHYDKDCNHPSAKYSPCKPGDQAANQRPGGGLSTQHIHGGNIRQNAKAMDWFIQLSAMQNKCLPSSLSYPDMMDHSFIHIFVIPEETEDIELQARLSRTIMHLAKEGRESGLLVYGVLALGGVSAEKICEMTTTVIQHGRANFSGQLFLVME